MSNPKKTALLERLYRIQFNPKLIKKYKLNLDWARSKGEIINSWVGVLVDMVAEYSRSSNNQILEVYVGERHRFFQAKMPPNLRYEYFNETLNQEEIAYSNHFGTDIDIGALKVLNQALLKSVGHNMEFYSPLNLLMMGDCVMQDVKSTLIKQCLDKHILVDLREHYFSTHWGGLEGFTPNEAEGISNIFDSPIDFISISFFTCWGHPLYLRIIKLGLMGLEENRTEIQTSITSLLQMIKAVLTHLQRESDAYILLHNVSGLPWLHNSQYKQNTPWNLPKHTSTENIHVIIGILNREIENLVKEEHKIILIDERTLVSRHGVAHCGSPVFSEQFFEGAYFHPTQFGRRLSTLYLHAIQVKLWMNKIKAIFIDLDYTLWDGVMSDSTVSHYVKRQKILLSLKESGVLLITCSKNDPHSIRWGEMHLCKDDFVLHRINWLDKHNNIESTASELRLPLSSFLFIDDDDKERFFVEELAPEVTTLDSTTETTWEKLELYAKLMKEEKSAKTAGERTNKYKDEFKRREHMTTERKTTDEIFQSLSMRVFSDNLTEDNIDRAVELFQRTNQFNCTNKRYSYNDLLNLAKSNENRVFVYTLSDRFGEMGIVGACVIKTTEGSSNIIENLVVSCRAIGYALEKFIIWHIKNQCLQRDLIGVFFSNGRNDLAKNLYATSGFDKLDDDLWVLKYETPVRNYPTWLTHTN